MSSNEMILLQKGRLNVYICFCNFAWFFPVIAERAVDFLAEGNNLMIKFATVLELTSSLSVMFRCSDAVLQILSYEVFIVTSMTRFSASLKILFSINTLSPSSLWIKIKIQIHI